MTTDFFISELMYKRWESQFGLELMFDTFLRTICLGLIANRIVKMEDDGFNSVFCEMEFHTTEEFTIKVYNDNVLIRDYDSMNKAIICYFEPTSSLGLSLNEAEEVKQLSLHIAKNKHLIG